MTEATSKEKRPGAFRPGPRPLRGPPATRHGATRAGGATLRRANRYATGPFAYAKPYRAPTVACRSPSLPNSYSVGGSAPRR